MILNADGKITDAQIQWLENQYPYFTLHNYIVIFNHVHILYEISSDISMGTEYIDVGVNCTDVGTDRDLSLRDCGQKKIKSISELMGVFKTTSSKKIHLAGNEMFQWQRSFYDHIVHNDISYGNISNYIANNPQNWKEDKFNIV